MLTHNEHTRPEPGPFGDGHDSSAAGERSRRPVRIPHPAILLGYTVAVVMGVAAVMILSGMIFSQGVPDRFRLMFGIVIALMSVYRFVLTRSRALQRRREEGEEG